MEKNTIPSNYTEDEVLAVIDRLAGILCQQFSFGYHERDDIKQEIFIFCWKSLPYYKPELGFGLEKFLYRCCKHKLLNFRRDHFLRPRYKCHCTEFKVCKTCQNRRSKRKLVEAASEFIEDDFEGIEFHLDNKIEEQELLKKIRERLPVDLYTDFLRMMEGVPLKKPQRDKVREVVATILEMEYV